MRRARIIALLGLAAAALGAKGTAAPAKLTFPQAVQLSVERSPAVGKQRAQVESTRSRNLVNRLILLPTLSATASQGLSQNLGPEENLQSLGVTADFNLFRFGADFATMAAARAEIRTQELLLADTVLQAEWEAIQGLVAYIASARKVEVLKRILESREQALKIAVQRFRRGLIAAEERDATEIDLANASAQLRDAQVEWVEAQAALERLLGEATIEPQWPWRERFSEGAPRALKWGEDRLRLRPDWRAADAQVTAADERKDAAWGAIFPSLDARFQYGYLRSRIAGTDNAGPQWGGSVSLSIPLFDRLENYGGYRAAVYERAAAEQDKVQVQRVALQQWRQARGSVEISLETARTRQRTLELARRVYQANLRRFDRGLTDVNELRVDQDRLYQSELFTIEGWSTVHTSVARLCHSLGMRVEECLNGK